MLDLASLATTLGFNSRNHLLSTLDRIHNDGYTPFVIVSDDLKQRRVIHAPRLWLKRIQRLALDRVLAHVPISDAAYCHKGRGVVDHAKHHVGKGYVTVMDVAKCFPSTTSSQVQAAFESVGMPVDVACALTRITTFHGILPQGPPSSPAVLNIVFLPIDKALQKLATARGGNYTRYMDDLAFSSNDSLKGLARDALRELRRFGYKSNDAKRRVWGPGEAHLVTKIVVTTTLNPDPEFLKDLSHHLFLLKSGDCSLSTEQLVGRVGWVKALNKALGARLERQLRSARAQEARAKPNREQKKSSR